MNPTGETLASSSPDAMLIGDLAAQFKLNRKTIRYYESLGLMPDPRRTEAGYRLYGAADRERLAFIVKAKTLGLSLEDIGSILDLRTRGETPCSHVRAIAEGKIRLIDQKLRDLEALRAELAALARAASSQAASPQTAEPTLQGGVCGLIEAHRSS